MERKEQFLSWADIARGVGSLIVDEAVLGVKAIFRMPRLFSPVSEHAFEHPLDDPTLFDVAYDSEGNWHNPDGLVV